MRRNDNERNDQMDGNARAKIGRGGGSGQKAGKGVGGKMKGKANKKGGAGKPPTPRPTRPPTPRPTT